METGPSECPAPELLERMTHNLIAIKTVTMVEKRVKSAGIAIQIGRYIISSRDKRGFGAIIEISCLRGTGGCR